MTYAKTGTARGSRRSGALSLPPSPCPLCLCGGTSYGNGLGIANFINHRDTENTETRARSLRQRLCFGRSDPSHGAEVEREERKWSVAASERQSRERSGEEIRVFPQSSETNRTFPKHKMFLATHLCLRDPEAIRTYLGLSEAIKKLKFFVTAAHIAFSAGFSLISG